MKSTALSLFIVFTSLFSDGTSYICNVSVGGDPSKWPKLPDLPESFKTNIEINLIEESSTLDAVEYFDDFGNRVALYTTKEGLDGVAVYDFPSNEVFYVTHGVCLVANITQRPEADLFGVTESDGFFHVMTSSTALKFGQQYNETYMGTDIIRGINVDHWRACLHWNRSNANFTVDYYFSKPNSWKTSSDFLTVPVRADVTGEFIHADGSNKALHHIYEYHAFAGSLDLDSNPAVFETPPGVICQGRKKTKPVPDFPKQFYYRQELVVSGIVTYIDVWYIEKYKYLRYDSRPLRPTNAFYTTNPVTEILDYNTGVYFYKDNILGNCTILPLKKSSFGAKLSRSLTNQTGDFMLGMQNPLELFYLDKGYTFVGTRPCRELTCDVFSAIKNNFVINGQLDTANTTIEVFLLSTDSGLTIYPENGLDLPTVVPVMMTLNADSVGYSETIQFYDFDDSDPDISVFDVSSCYNDMSKLNFNLRFPGRMAIDRHRATLQLTQLKLAETMGIEITRLQNLRIDIDYADVYIHASLLDRTPATSQFNYVGNIEVIDQGDMYIGNVLTPMQCADLCINVNFTCNSFDFCQQDPQRTCRLNQKHVSDGLKTQTSNVCGHFSRTVNGPKIPEKTILQAYQSLRLAVYSKQFQIQVEMDNQEMLYYLAVDTSVEFGAAKPTIMPKISGQVSYTQEVVIPNLAQVYVSKVWYDSSFKLARYDYHDSKGVPPYYSINPMTIIHDFSTGLQYVIDKYYENCTISPITPGQYDSELNPQEYMKDKSYVIKMKSPIELFHLNTETRYVGQKTVRNLLCDVFLGMIQSYTMPGLNGSHPAILEYYFLTGGWTEVGKDDDAINPFVPVKLDITIVDQGLFFTYNFFNFEVSHPDIMVFDIQKCYTDKQQHRFQIKFPGPFHPFIDINRKMFVELAVLMTSQAASVSPLRVQEARIDHDDDNIYVTATLMDKPPFLAEFTKIAGKVMPHKSAGFFVDISTADDCAHACVQTKSFPCNSFDICSSVHYCFISTGHVSFGQLVSNGSICDHYSRTENATVIPSPDLYTAYINLKNDIYSGILKVNIPTINDTIKTYTALTIRDTISQQTNVPQGGRPLKKFSLFKNNVIYKHNDEILTGVAVDDCAVACLLEELFDCQSFEYCQATEMCYLSKVQPDINTTLLAPSDSCNLYSRLYLDRYDKTPGVMYTTPGYETITGIQTDNLCAQQCSKDPDCKSFDYCINTLSCQLRRTHKLEMPNNTMTVHATCNHYSRKYINDFVIKTGRDMMIDSSQEIIGITADQCAKLCVDQEAGNCRSFIYCGNQTVCRLKSMPSKQAVVASQYCDLYLRSFNPDLPPLVHGCNNSNLPPSRWTTNPHGTQTPIITNRQGITSTNTASKSTITNSALKQNNSICSPQKQEETKNNPGVMVGLAFGVFIPGLILGALVMYFYKKYSIRSDDMHMELITDNK
ncbi:unnamed protein product [Mytilus coruscus]|uniref:Apple domain-containing protein n=1 Tax=Mytilus coruscus TaxID=42192 RepID=A0A6J8CJQ6_MYTCO|nr:unnamed protein product [Mytilus coruscus]